MGNLQKEVQTKLTKGLIDLIVLQLIDSKPMHGYQIITKIRRSFGVYFGPSTIYPLLTTLEKKGYLTSCWNMESERPRKMYDLTNKGKNMLSFTEKSLNIICKRITEDTATKNEMSETRRIERDITYKEKMTSALSTLSR